MDRNYSTLELAKHDETAQAPELFKHDETARAPERDHDATAFELDHSALAPETVPDTTPEVFYDGTLPEAHNNEKPIEDCLDVTRTARKWPWIIIALVLAAAIAVGVSVGIWHHRERSLQMPSRFSSPPAPNITQSPQVILEGTSLAAVLLSNGDRQLFFQDNTGLIQRAARVQSNGQWTTSHNLDGSTDSVSKPSSNPKRYTPLAATGPSWDADISLYYVSENHVVTSSYLNDGLWSLATDIGSYSTAVDTRSLSVSFFGFANGSYFLSPATGVINGALLFFENPNGNVSALLFRIDFAPQLDSWIDITSQESKALPKEFYNAPKITYSNTFSRTLYEAVPNGSYSAPFFSKSYSDGVVGATFYSGFDLAQSSPSPLAGSSALIVGYTTSLNGTGNFSAGLEASTRPSKDYASIHQSDLADFGMESAYAIWVNGTRPALLGNTFNPTLPSNEFPFKRLASVTLADGSATYLYHQMNGTTFAEEQWDDALQIWLRTEYITVSGP